MCVNRGDRFTMAHVTQWLHSICSRESGLHLNLLKIAIFMPADVAAIFSALADAGFRQIKVNFHQWIINILMHQ